MSDRVATGKPHMDLDLIRPVKPDFLVTPRTLYTMYIFVHAFMGILLYMLYFFVFNGMQRPG